MKMAINPLNSWIDNLIHPLVIAGPCSAESEEQVLSAALALDKLDKVKIFRAGIWKPRTRPGSFEGHGEKALPWLQKVKEQTSLLVAVEVANASHVELALKSNVDVLWIGARTSVNPFSVQEIANALKGTNIPVMIKNPINADLGLWIGAIERVYQAGIKNLAAIHRGFSNVEKGLYRNHPHWDFPIELKRRFTDLPIICDPSHIGGKREFIAPLSQKAMDLNFNGLMIETHMDPEKAWSDAAQQITPADLQKLITNLDLRREFGENKRFDSELEYYRSQIDRLDKELINTLEQRMKVVTNIGKAKIQNNITALQVGRWDDLMQKRQEIAEKVGLSKKYIDEIFRAIHNESVRYQTDLMNMHKADKKDINASL
jgi:chorismate mutase